MKYFLALTVLLAAVSIGSALKCFVCNSHENPDCYDMPEASRSNYLKDCNEKETEKPQNFTLCRKLHMFLDEGFGEINPAEDRVHRDCGYVEDDGTAKRKGTCYYKSGYNTRTWVCSCDFDQCNSATQTSVSLAVTLVIAPLGYLFRYFY